jgi:hypothetical protein
VGAKERLLLLFFSFGVCLFVPVSSGGLEISGKNFIVIVVFLSLWMCVCVCLFSARSCGLEISGKDFVL